MVVTRKKKAGSSNTTFEENEAVENASAETKISDSVTVNVEEPNVDAQFKNKPELTSEEARNGEHEKTNSEEEGNRKHEENHSEQEGGKVMEEYNDETAITAKMNGDNKAADDNISEDDEMNGQVDVMWEDSDEDDEEDSEENVADEEDLSDEYATEEEDGDGGDEISEEEAAEEEDDDDEEEEEEEEENSEEKGIAKGDGGKAEEHNTEKVEVTPKNIEKSKERSKKMKVQAESSKKVEFGDEPESSRKRKTKKRAESMGMIFICSSKTKNDCYQYRIFGLPETKKDVVKKIYTGMRLFLYDIDLKLMYGIYKAAGPGGYNIEPKAFKSQFPSQVRFKVLDDCLPLPEEKFKKVIKENYYTNTKFDCILTSEQVKKLCKLFISSSKRQKPKKLGRTRKAELHPVRGQRTRRLRPADERRLPLREERVYRERPRKRPRKAIAPLPPPRRPLTPPPPITVRSYSYERTLDVDRSYRRDPYLERRSPFRDGLDPLPKRRDPLPKRRDPYLERRSPYGERDLLSSRRDPYLERRYAYRDDPYVERRDMYRDGRDSYVERRDSLRDERDPYRDGRDLYLERRGLYREGPRSETYSSYRRGPISDRHDVYREDRGVEYRDSYRREEELERQPLSLETTRRVNDIGTRDAYVSYRERPSYAETIYSAEYPSRVGLPREYHL